MRKNSHAESGTEWAQLAAPESMLVVCEGARNARSTCVLVFASLFQQSAHSHRLAPLASQTNGTFLDAATT